MEKKYEIDESQYKADFMICDGYIKFSSELLRLSLLAMGGFGALVLARLKGDGANFLERPGFFLTSMAFFALCAGISLFHRFYASDSMSWYVSLLRAEKNGDQIKVEKEKKGLYKFLRRSEISLIISEWLFGAGVLFFIIAIFDSFSKI